MSVRDGKAGGEGGKCSWGMKRCGGGGGGEKSRTKDGRIIVKGKKGLDKEGGEWGSAGEAE